MRLNSLLLSLLLFTLHLFTLVCCELDSDLPGHMKPLGSHMPPQDIATIDHLPSPREFHSEYVEPRTPVLMRGALNNAAEWRRWKKDDYLRENFGHEEVGIEEGKKENRSDPRFMLTVNQFLDRYLEEDIYMVYDLPPSMYKRWELPRPLICGGFLNNLMHTYMWFSSGGTNSVLHTDSLENLHCLVSGVKKFVLIEPEYSTIIGPEHKKKGFYDVNVEKVDMTVYPELSRIPWYSVEVNEGDCLYLPYLWIHNVHSFHRNMGINIWWTLFKFNEDDCPPDDHLPEYVPMNEVEMAPEMMIMEALERSADEDGTVRAETLYQLITIESNGEMGITLPHITMLLEILQPGCHGTLTNYKQVSREMLKKGHAFLEGMSGGEGPERDGYDEHNEL